MIAPHPVLNALGVILGIVGAVLNAIGFTLAFPIWLAANVLLEAYFLQRYASAQNPDDRKEMAQLCGLYLIYIGTSSYGTWRCYLAGGC